ncbi:hypothetical protein C0995_007768 [Termitomyces sp. Mi166|nr:hypothetical protein C0995_007768 [Termitomyces sp. Mi166\
MTSTAANPLKFLDKVHFDGTNYTTFKNHVLITVRARGARGYLDRMIQKSENNAETDTKKGEVKATEWSSRTPSIEEWEERDVWALGLIIYNTKNPIRLGIKMDGTVAEAWNTLKENYEIAAMMAEKHLHATEFTDGMDFTKHIEDLREK